MNTAAWALVGAFVVLAVADWVAVANRRRPDRPAGAQGRVQPAGHAWATTLEYVAKPGATLALVGVAIAVTPFDPAVRAWFVAGLVLSLAGDVFLMLPGDRFVPGLVSFLLAHVAYIVGLVVAGPQAVWLGVGVAVVVVALVAVGRPIIAGVRGGAHPELAVPVSVYMGVISVMVVFAFASARPAAAVGACFFFVSDALIAWNRFRSPLPGGHVAVMVTYHLAQAGLVASLVG